MNHKLASIIFSREAVYRGISAEMMEDLMSELPKGTSIVNFAEDYCRNVMQITVTHDKFKEVNVGSILPEIVAKFTKDEDGEVDCELDFSEVLEEGYKVVCDENTGWRTKVIAGWLTEVVEEDTPAFVKAFAAKLQKIQEDTLFWSGGIISYDEPVAELTLEVMREAFDTLKTNTSTPRAYGKSHMQDHMMDSFRYATSQTLTLPEGFTVDPKMMSDEPKQSFPVNYIPPDTQTSFDSWYEDFGDFDFDLEEDEPVENTKKDPKFCQHKWKRVTGINRYYVICEHCEVRNKEEEEKQWE